MIINTESDRFIKDVIQDGEYDFLFKDLVVIDLGCNIGTFALTMLPVAKVIYAVDLAEENINNLTKTIEDNKITKIKPYLMAIGGSNRPRGIIKNGIASEGGWQLSDVPGDTTTRTLNSFMSENAIKYADILKLDVEGSEYEIITADDFPADRISTIIGETHYGDISLREAFRKRLVSLGYRYYELRNNHFVARK